jgi:hypothetical protein
MAIMRRACRATLPRRIAIKAAARSASQATPCTKKPAQAVAVASLASATRSALAPPAATQMAAAQPTA